MKTLIKNGRVLDPSTNRDGVYDILIEDKNIIAIDNNIDTEVDKVINAQGCYVMPGLIDMHVHLREPGLEHKETIKTGAMSAAKGGFTTICAMPNTNPVIDNEYMVEYIKLKAAKESVVNILPVGAITKGQKGEELANIGNMVSSGIVAISEDGHTVSNSSLYKKALTYTKNFNIPILAHCEDKSLVGKGVINAGAKAFEMGLAGISNDSEEVVVARDIILAKSTGAKLHLCHLSTAGSIELLEMAKKNKIDVTAEVCPHHFALTEDDIEDYDTNYKMNPPLRTKKDVKAIIKGLKSGVIEIIATDHAPHHFDEKNTTFDEAPFGIVGLETAVPLVITELVQTGHITPLDMAAKMSYNPAKRLNIEAGTLREGSIADVTIIDPNAEYRIDITKFASKSKNSPFHNRKVKGKVKYTIVEGNVVYEADKQEDKNDK